MSDELLAQDTVVNSSDKRVTSTHIPGNNKRGLDVSLIGGSSAAGGQSGPIKILKLTVTTAITNIKDELANAGQSTYNSCNIQNRSGVNIEWNSVSSWTLGDGWTIDNGTDFFIDLTQIPGLYVRALSGSGDIKVLSVDNTA